MLKNAGIPVYHKLELAQKKNKSTHVSKLWTFKTSQTIITECISKDGKHRKKRIQGYDDD